MTLLWILDQMNALIRHYYFGTYPCYLAVFVLFNALNSQSLGSCLFRGVVVLVSHCKTNASSEQLYAYYNGEIAMLAQPAALFGAQGLCVQPTAYVKTDAGPLL